MTDQDDFCEARISGAWVKMSIDDVLQLRKQPSILRCHECGGRVRAHSAANNGMRAHFEHFAKHDGCSLKSGFKGTKSPHPDAVNL